MRLLNARTMTVEDFSSKQIPPYAILSHTWEDGEVTLQDMERQTASTKAGYAKIRESCEQTLRDDIDYIWVDTCCIDKTSSAELSEAINAMFRWYQHSTICYAFLADMPSVTDFDESSPLFAMSRWFTRGWTLQELLAPAKLDFYSRSWDRLGGKSFLAKAISSITGIDEMFLRGRPVREASIAARMSWASGRETSREEDRSYSLLGLFDVHIPLLYGEGGKNAFLRLQEELIRTSHDQSIFAWQSLLIWSRPSQMHSSSFFFRPSQGHISVLAESPTEFRDCSNIVACNPMEEALPYIVSNVGVQVTLPIIFEYEGKPARRQAHAILWCRLKNDYWNILTIPVRIQGDRCGRSDSSMTLFNRKQALSRSFNRKLHLETRQDHHAVTMPRYLPKRKASVFVLRSLPSDYRVESASPADLWESWSPTSGRLIQRQVGVANGVILRYSRIPSHTTVATVYSQAANCKGRKDRKEEGDLIPIIEIVADDCTNVRIRTLRIAIRAVYSKCTSVKRTHAKVVTAFGSSVSFDLDFSSIGAGTSEWQLVPWGSRTSNIDEVLHIQLRKETHFEHDIHYMDVRRGTYPQPWDRLATSWRGRSSSTKLKILAISVMAVSALNGDALNTLHFGSYHEVVRDAAIIPVMVTWLFPTPVIWSATFKLFSFSVLLILLFWVAILPSGHREIFWRIVDAAQAVEWSSTVYWLPLGALFIIYFWAKLQHFLQKWCFPLFRLLMSLESAIDWIMRLSTPRRLMDPTLSYDHYELDEEIVS